ncbi:porphobilinogen synthase [Halodesulfovibrio sp. MK-HDV]|jgi:porphobilinogen synthase|uniref:porphobilinogen synthase n=1 Tax=unclassified Halodesulfovibrio TaxID=2644657 RepID=UPI0013693F1F|nr:porphobilinogen synthase [Halodesulfovibrio sp. MK-HDV]KAF1075270.1 Delta-aminolevulinic acid dehydratase [Halodesulfovibrio sp. MK-HDV]
MADFFRGRRLRSTAALRALVCENRVTAQDLIMPYFIVDTDESSFRKEISSMPGQFQLSLDEFEKQLAEAVAAGLRSIILFGIPKCKDATGSEGYADDGIVQRAVRLAKSRHPELVVITDVCLCEYTDHGHCGILQKKNDDVTVANDSTLELLQRVAVSHAKAGADIVAPSDMMDGRIQALREALDDEGFINLPIMSYAVKYSSAFYGPFRDAAESTPQSGDRKSYQMDPANSREALREATADVLEEADFLMVKPAGAYLDIIRMLRDGFDLPLAAYQVSGEYSMIMAAAQNDWIDLDAVGMESLTAIKRAGADLIITYFAEDFIKRGLVQ